MLSKMAAENYDARKFKVCGPWNNQRGGSWSEGFKPRFEDGLRTHTDNYSTLYETLVSQTDYGGSNGPAHPANAQLNFGSTASRKVRIGQLYGHILLHCGQDQGNNEKIKDQSFKYLGMPTQFDMDAVAVATQQAVVAIAAANAANVPILAANVIAVAAGNPAAPLNPIPPLPAPAAGVPGTYPPDWVSQLWVWIDVNIGSAVVNGNLQANQNSTFVLLKLADVGINRDTITLFYDLLIRLNKQRMQPMSVMDVWIKFHQSITFPRLLADRSISELLAPSVVLTAGPNIGQPDLASVASSYHDIWVVLWDRGEIKFQPAPKEPGVRSGRVDGMIDEIVPAMSLSTEDDAFDHQAFSYESYTHEANYNAQRQSQRSGAAPVDGNTSNAFGFLKDERNCWRCKGWGHTKENCPSNAEVKRAIAACIQGLQALQASESGRLQSMQQSRGGGNSRRPRVNVTRKSGPSPFKRNAPANPNAHLLVGQELITATESAMDVELVQYDDGSMYTADGVEVVQTESNALTVVAANTAAPVAVHVTLDAPAPIVVAPAAPEVCSIDDRDDPMQDIDATIAADFASSYSVTKLENVDIPEDEFVYYQSPASWTSAKAAAICAVSAVALAMGALAMGIRSGRGRAGLLLLSAASAHACANVTSPHSNIKVHSSNFSRFENSPMMPRVSAFEFSVGPRTREHGTVDTGTTECASGRLKLHLVSAPTQKASIRVGVFLD